MRAVVVLPTPRTPVRIQACGIRPVANALVIVRTIASWPMRSAKVAGRYLRASTRYALPPARPRSRPGALVTSFIGAPAAAWSHRVAERVVQSDRQWMLEASGRLTSDPNRSSLGLLPSGPDPVGEWLV